MKESTKDKLKEMYYYVRGGAVPLIPFLGDACPTEWECDEEEIVLGMASGAIRTAGLYMTTVDGLEIPGAIIYIGTTVPVALFNYMKSLADVEYNQEHLFSKYNKQLEYLP
ncbi:MAG: hypothetical protein KJ906_01670 [Nanoarchaeota archaeon]|nr:hypothetical protein [Nanoarchaeota archaeon]